MATFVIYNTADNNLVEAIVEYPDGMALPAQSGAKLLGAIDDAEKSVIMTQINQGKSMNVPGADGSYFDATYTPSAAVGQRITVTLRSSFASQADLSVAARRRRNDLLLADDWTQLADTALTPASKAAFANYRQALRDVPQQSGFPATITWPTRPAPIKL